MTVKERLIGFLEYKGISKSEFGRIIGVSSAFITSMRKSIQPDKVESIAFNFPELNINWLMTGEGEMLKTEAESPKPEELHLNDLIKAQAETINSQKLLISTLLEKIEGLQRALEERG